MKKTRNQLSNILELSRPWGWITTVLLFVGVYSNTAEVIILWPNLVISTTAITLTVAGAFAFNDWFDRFEDVLVHPDRVLPTLRMKPRFVLAVSMIELCAGALVLLVIDISHLLIGFVILSLSLIYSPAKQFKSILGNIIVAFLLSFVVFYAYSFSSGTTFDMKGASLVLAAFLVILSRELMKDIEDFHGEYGFRKTLPMILGVSSSYKLAAVILAAGICSGVFYVTQTQSLTIWFFLSPLACLAVITVFRITHASADEATHYIRSLKYGIIYFIIVFSFARWIG